MIGRLAPAALRLVQRDPAPCPQDTALVLDRKPGVAAQAAGVDQEPTGFRDDEIAAACRRLFELHQR